MRKYLFVVAMLITSCLYSQVSDFQWQKPLAGINYDDTRSIEQTTLVGFNVAGYNESIDGDAGGNHGYDDDRIGKLSLDCPDLSSAPDDVDIVNSTCGSGCTVSGGSISAPMSGCPAGSTLQYSTDNGSTWSATIPTYNQTGPAQTIITRCNCDSDNGQSSPSSAGVTTVPGTCTTPATPTITIVDNVCPSTTGTISATGCGAGTTLEWATNPSGPWSTITPAYTETSFTVYARCIDDVTGCVGSVASATTAPTDCSGGDCSAIFISEYIEGSSNSKALEIYNPTASAVTLTGNASVKLYFNGSNTAGQTISLTGTIAAYGTFVLAHTSAAQDILDVANQTSGNLTFNGDDAVELIFGGNTVDVIGQIGFDPGTEWGSGNTSTADNTIRRKSSVKKGDSDGSNAFDPSVEWDGFAMNTFSGLGSHDSECNQAPSCPDLSSAPDDVDIVNSTCGSGCTVSGGSISAPMSGCPAGSTLQYSTDNGSTWSATIPTYNQTGPAQTIITRCNCDSDNGQSSPSSAGVTTVPGTCTTPATPTITIVDNVCPSTTGTISATGCGAGTTLEWATNPSGPWSTITPAYTETSFTVYARCIDDVTGCVGSVASATTAPTDCSGGDCSAIFISEYIEGSSNSKALEIYNPTASAVTLTGNASVKLYFNGSNTAGQTISLTGTIAAYGTFVLAHTSAAQDILDVANQTSGNLTFNGDDAVELIFGGNTVDVIGQIGFDPGTEWGSGNTSTADNTIRRKSSVKKGDSDGSNAFDPSVEWDGFAMNTFSGLGSHYSQCDPASPCPDLSAAPEDVIIVNSTCGTGCMSSGGSISPPASGCPVGSTLQYSTDNGATWSNTLPVYNQNGPAQTIITRCNCDNDNTQSSPPSSGVTTVPGLCPGPPAPTITIVDNVCPSTTGTISATGCGTGTTLEWATNPLGPWSVTTPSYTNQAFTVYARCKDDISGCVSTVASATTAPTICPISDCSTIFFSEYVEGTSNNKALEIYNPSASTVTLSGNAIINIYANGGVTPGNTINLTGTIAPYGTFVITHSSASASLLALADMTSNAMGYNGNDAIELVYNGSAVDVIGQIGFDPGVEWGTGNTSTADNTIRRKITIKKGDNNPYDVFDPATEWDGFPVDTYDDLRSHLGECTPPCPDLTSAPDDVIIVNSSCGSGCTSTGGSISPPAWGCPLGSTLMYSTDNGVTWSATIPVYNQNGPVQTIQTRCDCDYNGNVTSPVSNGVTTAPGLCPGPDAPVIDIVDNDCPSMTGTISGSGCGTGTTLEWALDPSGPWSITAPTYTQMSFTVYARCKDDVTGCTSQIVSATTSPTICPPEDCSLIFFSEYVEGTSNNKALEIFNPTSSTVTLAGNATIKIYANGSNSAGNIINLNGSIPAYGTYVIGHINAVPAIIDASNQLSNILNFNGDDAIELVFNGSTVDVIGQIGFDPGTEWGTGLTSTADNTLRRKVSVKIGDADGSDAFDPSTEWDGYATDTFNGLGSHQSECAPPCPDLTGAPDDVVVVNSICGSGCIVSGGSISAPDSGCPTGSTMQYSTDNGMTWSVTLPSYNQTGPAQTIITRCNCDNDNAQSSPSSAGVTTEPGVCTPPSATAGSNSPVCVGGTINLTSSGGTGYSWSGPNSFNSNLQNPTITNATAVMSGTYTVTVTDVNGCTATATTNVVINALPAATASSNSPVCVGATISLTSSGGTSYSWSGPGGFTSTLQNPTRTNATVAMSGNYTVTVTNANGCSAVAVTNVTVNPLPVATAGSNSPVCAGATINLTSTGGTSYSWSGPGGWTSTLQNPTRVNATAAMAGTYNVTVTSAGGCSSTASTNVIVNPLPVASAKADPNPVCSGHYARLYAGGVSYLWSGPNGFTSTLQNPGLGLAQINMAGNYTVTVTNAEGCSSTASVNLVVNQSPNGTASVTPQFVCVGNTAQLSASGGQSYLWRGPGGFVSTQQNPVINVTSHVQGGTYWVTISNANGCYVQLSVELTVSYPPAVTATHEQSTACTGSTLKLFGSGVGTYLWTGPGGWTSTQQNPQIPNVTPANSGTYTLKVTAPGGCSATATTTVNVVAPPSLTAWADDYDICEFSTAYLHATGATGYEWSGPWGYYSTFQHPVMYYVPVYMTGTYTVKGTGPTGCSATKSFDLNVYLDINGTISATPNPVLYGGTLQLQATGGTSYLWTGPNGFYSTQPNPVINRINRNHAGIYAVIISNEGGCELTLFVKVDVVNPKGGDNLINVTTTKIAEGKIYPNPASNQITLQSNSDAPTVYSIIDMQGRIVVKNATTDNGQVNVEHLAPGIYNVMWSQPDVMGDAFKGRFVKVK
ncbi:MAG TPA: lamin tail domain-containing protein [Saprospiraceae bacterium]|nr:lamin tail domain-containing protein [Saprospiraceae bacterium]